MAMVKQYLYIKKATGKGKGVFTKEKIAANTLIEEAPVIVMNAAERILLDKTLLHDYIFEWGDDKSQCCMALGFVPIYNHSYASNCEYFMDFEEEIIQIKTVREIKAEEELTINYNGDWNDKKKVWFEIKE
ncbi:MAG TPA: SET domain-containing protein [Hanamia sp.]|nr:SET domain-containing protein [Hanamia sp.]